LFISLGWNFLQYGFFPPDGGWIWSWVVCGVLFVVMGAVPLVVAIAALRDGRFTRIDREAALEELAASLRVDLKPEEERRRRLSREVFPMLQRFYEGWLDEEARRPFYRSSSRT
jgi:hypothetical protein